MTAPDSRLDSSKAGRPDWFGRLFVSLFLIAFTYLVRLPYLDISPSNVTRVSMPILPFGL